MDLSEAIWAAGGATVCASGMRTARLNAPPTMATVSVALMMNTRPLWLGRHMRWHLDIVVFMIFPFCRTVSVDIVFGTEADFFAGVMPCPLAVGFSPSYRSVW